MSKSFSAAITRCPRVFDAEKYTDAVAHFADAPAEVRELIGATASVSPFLASLIEKEKHWLRDCFDAPKASVNTEISAVRALSLDDVKQPLRQAKRRVALITALADLGGIWELAEVTGVLTSFADAACDTALKAGLLPLLRNNKIPGRTEDDLEDAAGLAILAMGKMGAGELNYSSDIDLICLFDESRFEAEDYLAARTAFVRATRAMSGILSDLTGDGYVFRTDLRLRPDPAVTPVCIAMEAAERYYESVGRTWERAAYIKARACAGNTQGGREFIGRLTPFVWRRHLDFAAIQDAHDMRLAIREHKGLGGPITLPGHNMKLGRGGIREIEFFTQTRQLIAGGRDPDLRRRGTVDGLVALANRGWISDDVSRTLTDHYVAHRTVEHRVQMVRDAQTHELPRTDEEFERLAAMMDLDVADQKKELLDRLSEVHSLTDGFFADKPSKSQAKSESHSFDSGLIQRWLSYPALRSERGAALFEQLKPDLLQRLSRSSKPDEALIAFDGFLNGLPAGVQFFSLLKANPSLFDLLIDTVSISPALAQYLSRNAGVFDAVIAGDFFSDWPGEAALTKSLGQVLDTEASYEGQLDGTRRWARDWHFRIGVHYLRGLTSAATAGAHYADLARAILSALWPVVTAQFAKRHGMPPGRGAVLLGMGSLGSGRLTATSDLDLLVIYDPLDQDGSTGPRPLPARTYYARLTQAMITAMSAPMAQGKLYEIDMSLRPSGNQGPVATSVSSFDSYQRDEAWVWEHLALTRARVVAGPEDLGRDVSKICAEVLAQPSDPQGVMADVVEMRSRIAAAKVSDGAWDAKIGPGRLQDIELFAQTGALLKGTGAHAIADGLRAAEEMGLTDSAGTMIDAYDLCWRLQCASRLISSSPLQDNTLGQASSDFLARSLGSDTITIAKSQLEATYAETSELIDAALKAKGSP